MKVLLQTFNTAGEAFKAGCKALEPSLLIFPVLVTVGLATMFLFGGHLSAWHWWGAVIVVTGVCLARKQWKSGAWFLAFLAGLWLLAGLSLYLSHIDYLFYHFSGIRLLIQGWNPVTQSTFTDLEQMGVALNELRPYHMLFMSKAVWYFTASAYTFTQTPFNLLFPLFAFLFCSTAMQLCRMLNFTHWGVRLLACALLWNMTIPSDILVDSVVTLAGIGLLCTMVRALRGDNGVFLPLIVFSFWMMTAKLPGLLSCFVFWVCFSVALLIRSRAAFLKLAFLGGILLVLLCITCASPYYTAWRDYGHPLYPTKTVDEVQTPAFDLTGGAFKPNEDAAKMGYIGSFWNAYISNSMAMAYYRWKLEDPDFAPTRPTWQEYNPLPAPDLPTSPTPSKVRVKFLVSFLILLVLGRKKFAFLSIALALGMIAYPPENFGYERYYPWINLLYLLGPVLLTHWVLSHLPILKPVVACLACGYLLYVLNSDFAKKLDFAYAQQRYFEDVSIPVLYSHEKSNAPSVEVKGLMGDAIRTANLRLLQRAVPALSNAQIVTTTFTTPGNFRPFFNQEFYLPVDAPLEEYSPYLMMRSLPKKERKKARLAVIAKAYGIALPHLIARRLAELL